MSDGSGVAVRVAHRMLDDDEGAAGVRRERRGGGGEDEEAEGWQRQQ